MIQKKLILTMSAAAAMLVGAEIQPGKVHFSGSTASSQKDFPHAEEIIPPAKDFSFNSRWEIPTLCGKHFWYSLNGVGKTAPIYDLDRFAFDSFGEIKLGRIADCLLDPRREYKGTDAEKHLVQLVRNRMIPLTHRQMYTSSIWNEKDGTIIWRAMPTPAQMQVLCSYPAFTGWVLNAEWASNSQVKKVLRGLKNGSLEKQVKSMVEGGQRGEAMFRLIHASMPKLPRTRREFSEGYEKIYRGYAAPFHYQINNHPGHTSWGIQWPAIWGARSIVTENRYGGLCNPSLQALTRSAGRMGNIPWGYAPGATFDVTWSFGPYSCNGRPVREDLQMARGTGIYPQNLMRRLWYYWCMGNVPFIRDEETRVLAHDIDSNGTANPTRYLHTIQEVMDFSDRHPDRGTPYTPIALLLSWTNGYMGADNKDKKAFCLFDYNDGEHMTQALLDTVIFPCRYSWSDQMDLFGATPYGDLYDILRIDTPKGPLPMELLQNYKVLFAVGEQNFTEAVTRRLKDYVRQGGVLILNAKQISGNMSDRKFLGLRLSEQKKKASAMTCVIDGKKLLSGSYDYSPLIPEQTCSVLYQTPTGETVVARNPYGKGYVITIGADWMLESARTGSRGNIQARILPLAHDMLRRLVRSVLPLEVLGEHVRERVLYQVNRKGTGWVISLYNNSGRDSRGGREPEQVNPDCRVEVSLHVPRDCRYAVEWISSNRLLLLDQPNSETGKLVKIPLKPGEVKIVELQPQDIPPVTVMERMNLALNCPAKASSYRRSSRYHKGSHDPSMAVNGNREIFDAWWSEKEILPDSPQWLEIDLGEVLQINAANTVFMWSEDNDVRLRIYQYYIEVSTDGRIWKKIIDETRNMSVALPRGDYRCFPSVSARYVRVTTTLNTAASGAQIVEFEVYGDRKVPVTYHWGKKITIPLKLRSHRKEIPAEIRNAKKVTCLSDLPAKILRHPNYELESDKNSYTLAPLSIGGTRFARGLGSHAPSEIVYNLPAGKWKYFAAQAGIDDCSTIEASVDFVIYLDGVEKLRTGRMKLGEKAMPVWLPLGNAKTLKLVLEDCGDGVIGDIADWAEARLTR